MALTFDGHARAFCLQGYIPLEWGYRDNVNTSGLDMHSEGVAPGSWWAGAPWAKPHPVYCASARHGWTGMLIDGSGETDRVCTTLVLLSVQTQIHVC